MGVKCYIDRTLKAMVLVWSYRQVYQREYDQMFGTRDYDTVTGHLSFYYQDPRSNVLFHLRGGRYLAKDSE